ncbi:hypothetical protein ACWEKM_30735, partial [Streptomyces sp. NPDC004752]
MSRILSRTAGSRPRAAQAAVGRERGTGVSVEALSHVGGSCCEGGDAPQSHQSHFWHGPCKRLGPVTAGVTGP